MTTITWRDLRENLADWINRVRYSNERVQITRHGKVVAELIPPQSDRREREQSAMTSRDSLALPAGEGRLAPEPRFAP